MLEREARGLEAIRSRPVMANPLTVVDLQENVIHDARDRARRLITHWLDRSSDEIGHHLARVRALSPLATLERGYAVAHLADGTVIRSVVQVPPDTELTVRLADGNVGVRSTNITDKDGNRG